MAKGALFGNVIYRELSRAAPGAKVTVYHRGTTDKADLFSDNGSVAIQNPLTATNTGLFSCTVEQGSYDLVASVGSLSATEFDVVYSLSGTLSSSGLLLTPIDRGNFVICSDKPLVLTTINWLARASGTDTTNNSSFVIELPELVDQQDMYTPTTGEFEATNDGIYKFETDGTFQLSTSGGTQAEAEVKLQKYISSWQDQTTLTTLAATSGSPDSNVVDTSENITLNAGEKLRVFFDLTVPTAGTDTCAADPCTFTFSFLGVS